MSIKNEQTNTRGKIYDNFLFPLILIIFIINIYFLFQLPRRPMSQVTLFAIIYGVPSYMIFYSLIFISYYLIVNIINSFTEQLNKINYLFIKRVTSVLTFLLVLIVIPSTVMSRHTNTLWNCECNLKNIATVLEMYSIDDPNEHYPPSLDYLTKRQYLQKIPVCSGPSPGFWQEIFPEFFSKRYNSPYGYTVCHNPENFTLWCTMAKAHVSNERVFPEGCWPQYSSFKGIIEKPE